LAEAGLPIAAQPADTMPIEGEETMRDELQTPPREDVVDVDGKQAGRDSRSNHTGSGATEETPDGSISPQ
jgi:hypothetical protein